SACKLSQLFYHTSCNCHFICLHIIYEYIRITGLYASLRSLGLHCLLSFLCCLVVSFLALCVLFLTVLSSALVRLNNSVCHLGNDQFYSADSVVISRDHIVKLLRIAVCVSDTDQRDSQCVSLLHTDSLFLRVNDEDRIRQSLHLFDPANVLLLLLPLFFQLDNFSLSKNIKCSVRSHCLDFFQTCHTALDGLEVCQHSAEPSLIYIEHTAALCLCLDSVLSLFLCSYEQDRAALCRDIRYCLVSLIYFSNGFLQ